MDSTKGKEGAWRTFASTAAPRFSSYFLGLVAIRVWLQCCLYDRYAATDFGSFTVYANLVRVAFIVVLMTLAARSDFSAGRQRALSYASVTAMTLAAVLFLIQFEFPSEPLYWIALVLAGAGVAWGGGMWICFFVRLGAREAFAYAFACLGISALFGFLLGLFPPVIVYALAVFMPTISYVSYCQVQSIIDERPASPDDSPRDAVYDAEPGHTLVQLLAGVALLEFALGMARGFPFGASIGLTLPFQALHQGAACAISFGFIAWAVVVRRRLRFSDVWRFVIVLLIAGMLLIATLDDGLAEIGATLITLSNTLMIGILWYCAYDFSRHSSIPAYLVLGAVWIAHMLPREIGRQLIILIGPQSAGSVLVVTAMSCLLAFSVALVLRDSIPRVRPLMADFAGRSAPRRSAESGDGSPDDAASAHPGEGAESKGDAMPKDSIEERSLVLQKRFSLTNRETEMILYLAQGRSKAAIAERLFISENTVKSYTRSLYQKLGVHSKQELLNMLDRTR
ncbi:helix-turn-helix transcriptional regulator [Curtanaerobium respiraculi]|uniref:helix-turn-helix transcriptional regulator n=1 Tax=Curtanaerobium respiraculi TaxID=2949669 RepID=UPI0024B36DC6|nr:LuxR family transcriptional regulator [Curtanaerobium respiraculi]